jgi:hypothetical protein
MGGRAPDWVYTEGMGERKKGVEIALRGGWDN